jgi:uncharacterized protein (DUF58 family)
VPETPGAATTQQIPPAPAAPASVPADRKAAAPAERVDPYAEPAGETDSLLDPKFLGKLKQLTVVTKKAFMGRFKGERRSKKRGVSIEFADFRNYVHGDDPRFIDWNTYGRLEKLFLKLFVEEEDLSVQILVDASRSMRSQGKFRYAKRLAAALSYVSLLSQDRVSIGSFSSGLEEFTRPLRGKAQAPRLLRFLDGLKADGSTSIFNAVKRHLLINRQPGLVVLISDFLDDGGYESALKALQGRQYDVFAIQVLSPAEIDPPLRGDLRLIDAETGAPMEVSITPRLLESYRAAVKTYCDGLKDFCAKRGMGYLLANSGENFEDLVLKYLRVAGLVR